MEKLTLNLAQLSPTLFHIFSCLPPTVGKCKAAINSDKYSLEHLSSSKIGKGAVALDHFWLQNFCTSSYSMRNTEGSKKFQPLVYM